MKTVIATILLLCAFCVMSLTNSFYATPVTVIDTDDDLVTVMDHLGNEWMFYGDGYSVNDELVCVFDGQNTTTIYDDVIVDVM